MIENIVCIIVSYKATSMLRACINSIRRVYPSLKIMIIDGSPAGSPCYQYIKALKDDNIKKVLVEYNIGHGNGMRLGINMTTEKYILLCDSDVVISRQCLVEMYASIDRRTYGVGQVVKVNMKGVNDDKGFDYLHPHFALISREQYFAHEKPIHHGAPLIRTMHDVFKKRAVRVKDFPVARYVVHKERGTRKLSPKEFDSKYWEK